MNIKQGYFVAPFYYFFMVYLPIMVAIILFVGLTPTESASVAMGYAGLQVLWVLFFREMSIHREHTYSIDGGERRLSMTGIIDMMEKEWAKHSTACKKCGSKFRKNFILMTDAEGVVDMVADRSIKCESRKCALYGKKQ